MIVDVEVVMTLSVFGDERDLPVRCAVDVGPVGASLDSDPEVYVDGAWWFTMDLDLGPRDYENITESLCDAAFARLGDGLGRDASDFGGAR